MARASGSVAGVPPLALVEIDGVPYVDADWLALRLYRDQSRMERWQQEARRVARRTDPDGISLCASYQWQALAMSYRILKWQRCLALTQTAVATYQRAARIDFGLLVQGRRIAAGWKRPELAQRAALDRKTVWNIESGDFQPSVRVLQSIVAVPELSLTWADVNPILREKNPAAGTKHRPGRQASNQRRRQAGAHVPKRLRRKLTAALASEWMPLDLPRAQHVRLGKMLRQLRAAAGLTRTELAREANIRADGLKRAEIGKKPLPRWALFQLLRHPCMRDLPARVGQAGIKLDLDPGSSQGQGVVTPCRR